MKLVHGRKLAGCLGAKASEQILADEGLGLDEFHHLADTLGKKLRELLAFVLIPKQGELATAAADAEWLGVVTRFFVAGGAKLDLFLAVGKMVVDAPNVTAELSLGDLAGGTLLAFDGGQAVLEGAHACLLFDERDELEPKELSIVQVEEDAVDLFAQAVRLDLEVFFVGGLDLQ